MSPDRFSRVSRVGRAGKFLRQDADQGMDRLTRNYVRFMLEHRVLTWIAWLVILLLIVIFVSGTLAIVLVGIQFALMLYSVASLLWRRGRGTR
jgi:hypothetical protein